MGCAHSYPIAITPAGESSVDVESKKNTFNNAVNEKKVSPEATRSRLSSSGILSDGNDNSRKSGAAVMRGTDATSIANHKDIYSAPINPIRNGKVIVIRPLLANLEMSHEEAGIVTVDEKKNRSIINNSLRFYDTNLKSKGDRNCSKSKEKS